MDQETFSAGGASVGWPYAKLYRSILGIAACMSDARKAGSTEWCRNENVIARRCRQCVMTLRRQVFGGISREMLAGTVQGEPRKRYRHKGGARKTALLLLPLAREYRRAAGVS